MQNSYRLSFLALLAVALLAVGCSKPSNTNNQSAGENQSIETANSTEGATVFTMADVEAANAESNCYTIIRGSVYNLTEWIAQHPGGKDAILRLCGTDGTDFFVNQHGGNAPQEAALARFKIGELAN